MKANEAPERLYLSKNIYSTYLYQVPDPDDETAVEYTRSDALEMKKINNIWHEASETPKGAGDKEILVQFADSHASVLEIDDWEYLDHQTKWAYLKDLI